MIVKRKASKRRTLDKLVKKILVEKEKDPTDKAIENKYRKLH